MPTVCQVMLRLPRAGPDGRSGYLDVLRHGPAFRPFAATVVARLLVAIDSSSGEPAEAFRKRPPTRISPCTSR